MSYDSHLEKSLYEAYWFSGSSYLRHEVYSFHSSPAPAVVYCPVKAIKQKEGPLIHRLEPLKIKKPNRFVVVFWNQTRLFFFSKILYRNEEIKRQLSVTLD